MGLQVLGGMTPATFLADYWQKQPLLVRQALPGFTSPLTPEALLSLACAEGISSRLVLEHAGQYPWELCVGPFEEEELRSLPSKGWTLLVGGTERHVPAAARVLDHFRFLPNWRMDDLQISYAPPGGNAGPHVDSYDVFLIEGFGRRRWQISRTPAPEDVAWDEDADIAILKEFAPDDEWILDSGDLLYLPPRLPHLGVALDPCMTCSVGFRAPGPQDIVCGVLEETTERCHGAPLFGDSGRAPSAAPGRIEDTDLAWVRQTLRTWLLRGEELDRWFGTYITRSASGLVCPSPRMSSEAVQRYLKRGHGFRRVSPSILAYIEHPDRVLLYADGKEYVLPCHAAGACRLLTGTERLTYQALKPYLAMPVMLGIVTELVNRGCLSATE